MLAQSALLITLAAQAPVVLLLTYFFAGIRHALPTQTVANGRAVASAKERCIANTRGGGCAGPALFPDHADIECCGWLLTQFAFEILGLDHASVWGVVAGILHFIPYPGTVTIALASGISGFL